MNELVIDRHNHLIDPALHIWGLEVPLYLFLGGFAAGLMILTGYLFFSDKYKRELSVAKYLPLYSILAISIGMFFLFLDLENKLNIFRFYTTFQITSPMSWGSWILIFVYPVMIASFLVRVPYNLEVRYSFIGRLHNWIIERPKLIKTIGIVSMSLGGVLGLYTGVLLSFFGARPLWNSGLLWLLFLVSGLSTAAAFAHVTSKRTDEKDFFTKADNAFLGIEIIVMLMFILSLVNSGQVYQDAAMLLLSGAYAPVFWAFVIGIGLIIPLILQLLVVNHKLKHTFIVPLMVILGSLFLRIVIVYAGQTSHWPHNVFSLIGF